MWKLTTKEKTILFNCIELAKKYLTALRLDGCDGFIYRGA